MRIPVPPRPPPRAQDERSLQRYTLALERDACRRERERLRELEQEEAEAVADLAKAEVRRN